MDNLTAVITMVAEHLGLDATKITAGSRFVEDLNADSLDMVELMMEFEHKFSITISDAEAENIHTIADVVAHIPVV